MTPEVLKRISKSGGIKLDMDKWAAQASIVQLSEILVLSSKEFLIDNGVSIKDAMHAHRCMVSNSTDMCDLTPKQLTALSRIGRIKLDAHVWPRQASIHQLAYVAFLCGTNYLKRNGLSYNDIKNAEELWESISYSSKATEFWLEFC